MNTKYQWRAGSPGFGVPALVAGAELERIEAEAGGHVTPKAVVEASRPESAPLHPSFTWDDQVAAEKFREDEARNLIRSIRIVREDEGAPQPVVSYVHVEIEDVGPAYVTTARAMSDEELSRQVVADVVAGLRGWQKRYEHISELTRVFSAMDRELKKVETRLQAKPRKGKRIIEKSVA